MLRKYEQLCQYYAIPILFLDSHKLVENLFYYNILTIV